MTLKKRGKKERKRLCLWFQTPEYVRMVCATRVGGRSLEEASSVVKLRSDVG